MNKIAANRLAIPAAVLALVSLFVPACDTNTHKDERQAAGHKITATSPQLKGVTLTQDFVCQIRSERHIQVRALERGYLQAVQIKEGQQVKAGEVMFKVIPVLYKANADAEQANADYAQLQYNNTKNLADKNVVSQNELLLLKAKLASAEANAQLADAELNFAAVKAPFDGIIDRLHEQQGSLVEDGTILTTLSDNSVMWVYFNVPEATYLDDLADPKRRKDLQVDLRLADGTMFNHVGKIGAVEADFNNQMGTVPFRADFPNPDHLLRNGQTGTVLVRRVLKDALVIPQRATFELADKRYVYVVDKDHVAHQREIVVQHELEDLFVIKQGLTADDKIVLEGIRQVGDGEKVEYDYRPPQQVDSHLKYHAE